MGCIVVFGFIAIDCTTGIIKAVKNKKFTSSIMREGLFHKIGNILAVLLGIYVDYAMSIIDFGVNVPIAIPICVYISTMELGSIIENIGEINPSLVSGKFRQIFAKLNKGVDE